MKKFSDIILDDSKDHAELLKQLIETYCEEVEIIKIFHTPMSLVAELTTLDPDILFIDIIMPEFNGLELLDVLPEGYPERTIFVTGYEQFAIEAIKRGVFDYLLKPLSPINLRKTIKRFADQRHKRHFAYGAPQRPSNHILINRHDKAVLLNLDNINYIEAQGSYTKIACSDNEIIQVSKPISYFKQMMSAHKHFLPVNQSYLINMINIKEIEKETGRDAVLIFHDETSLLLMQRTKDNLIKLIKRQENKM